MAACMHKASEGLVCLTQSCSFDFVILHQLGTIGNYKLIKNTVDNGMIMG